MIIENMKHRRGVLTFAYQSKYLTGLANEGVSENSLHITGCWVRCAGNRLRIQDTDIGRQEILYAITQVKA